MLRHPLYCFPKKRHFSDFKAGDHVVVTPLKKSVTKRTWLSRPLKDLSNAKVNCGFGHILHTDIIGKSPLSKVHTIETKKKLAKYIVSHPTLEQWIADSQRKAQPIYTFDAQAIVALTDLHVDFPEPPTEDGGKITPLQFLEAGTGHGSLSLAISKAIHPANALAHYSQDPNLRGAVLHTIDCNGSHSITGKRTIKGFRRGMYLDNVEFHVSDSPSKWVESAEGQEWIERELVSKKEKSLEYDSDEPKAFLSGVFLDMPNYHQEIVNLAPYIKTGGFIIVFCPSITQIIDAIDAIANENERLSKLSPPSSLHLEHERSVQLLDGAGGGLKEWDTRRVEIRATGKIGYAVRPKVGVRSVAGGFVAIWRKMGKDVDLDVERELINSYEGKPDPEREQKLEIENSEDDGAVAEELVEVVETRSEKADNFKDDLLSTDPEVFKDAEEKIEQESLADNEEIDEQLETEDVNPDFKVQEATLIPRNFLHTIHRSCHGDPDVHVGYMSDVYMISTVAPESEDIAPAEDTSDELVSFNETAPETNSLKSWTKHTL